MTFFDTADVYSLGASEEVAGRLLRKAFPKREDYVLATKVRVPLTDAPNAGGLSIVGATKLDHLEDAIAAVSLTLSPDEVARLEEPYRPHPGLGHE